MSAEFIAIIGMGVVVLLAAVGGFIAQIRYTSKLPTQEELHAVRDELRQEMQVIREEFRRDMMTMREELREEFRRDVNSLRQEMAMMRDELLTAIHDSEARIIKALVNHRHPQTDGPPIFIEPI